MLVSMLNHEPKGENGVPALAAGVAAVPYRCAFGAPEPSCTLVVLPLAYQIIPAFATRFLCPNSVNLRAGPHPINAPYRPSKTPTPPAATLRRTPPPPAICERTRLRTRVRARCIPATLIPGLSPHPWRPLSAIGYRLFPPLPQTTSLQNRRNSQLTHCRRLLGGAGMCSPATAARMAVTVASTFWRNAVVIGTGSALRNGMA